MRKASSRRCPLDEWEQRKNARRKAAGLEVFSSSSDDDEEEDREEAGGGGGARTLKSQ